MEAIERGRLANDLVAVNDGKNTLHLITSDAKKIGIWNLITLIVKMVAAWKKL